MLEKEQIPAICPHCKKGTKRQYLGSISTLLGWTPTYDESGKMISKDPNITKDSWKCLECNNVYEDQR